MIKCNKYLVVIIVFASFLLFSSYDCVAQTTTQNQFWPEVDGIYKLNDRFQVVPQICPTIQDHQKVNSAYTLNLDYFALPFFRKMKGNGDSTRGYYEWLRIGYTYGQSTAGQSNPYKENILDLESNTRFHLPQKIVITFKNRFDTRVFNGELTENYRPRLTLERSFTIKHCTIVPYVYGEYFLDFNTATTNISRLSAGSVFWVSKIVNFEIYYLKQYQQQLGNNNTLNALNVTLKFSFARKPKKGSVGYPAEEEKVNEK
jgi:Protein of unknown function (DUF2490)